MNWAASEGGSVLGGGGKLRGGQRRKDKRSGTAQISANKLGVRSHYDNRPVKSDNIYLNKAGAAMICTSSRNTGGVTRVLSSHWEVRYNLGSRCFMPLGPILNKKIDPFIAPLSSNYPFLLYLVPDPPSPPECTTPSLPPSLGTQVFI